MKAFKSILEFQNHFNSDEKCRLYLEQERWNGTPCCPFCGSVKATRLKDNKRFQCNEKECRKQFSVTVGTVAENTKIPLTKWFLAMYILSNHSKGISSLQLASWLGVTQKTAWFLNHRIREMLTDNEPELLNEIVEIDETYIGGKESNKHKSKRITKGGAVGKAMVLGAIQRKGKVFTKVIAETTIENVTKVINENVDTNALIITDEHKAYNKVKENYLHEKINHRSKEYVRSHVHTNTIEGYWNVLKKQIVGIHHFVSPKHLQRYCNENAYRYNNRQLPQDAKFTQSIAGINGRLKYKQLIGKA